MMEFKIKDSFIGLMMMFSWGRAALRFYRGFLARRRFNKVCDTRSIFKEHYETNWWGNAESVSGSGSTMEYTASVRKEIPVLVEVFSIKKVFDAPCGDYNWFKDIKWKSDVSYIGGDIVEPLVNKNRTLYETDLTTFVELDISNDPFPKADLWLCRDCLFHLSEHDIFLALDNFVKSDIPYILTSTHSDCVLNHDIPSGSFRLLNLQLAPFCLGKPIQLIDDWIEGYPVRHLALWDRKSLVEALSGNEKFLKAVGVGC